MNVARIALAVALLALAAGAPSEAADRNAGLASDQPDPAAEARAKALVNATAGAAAAFRVDQYGRLIHIQSGMKCAPGGDPPVLSGIYIAPLVTPGDDVGCDWHGDDVKISVFVTRLGDTPIAQFAKDAVAAMKQMYPDASGTVKVFVIGNTRFPEPIVAGFPITLDGRPFVTSLCVSEQRGWAVKVRAIYPAGARKANLVAGLRCGMALQDIHDHRDGQ